jgi:hypothetical protein
MVAVIFLQSDTSRPTRSFRRSSDSIDSPQTPATDFILNDRNIPGGRLDFYRDLRLENPTIFTVDTIAALTTRTYLKVTTGKDEQPAVAGMVSVGFLVASDGFIISYNQPVKVSG